MKKKKRMDVSQVLIFAALMVMTARYAGAFLASDLNELNGWVSAVLSATIALSGIGMGVLDVLGAAYVFDGWRQTLPRTGQRWPMRFRVLTGIVIALFVSGIVILVPFTVSRLVGHSMSSTLAGGWLWLWAVMVNLAPYLLIGGVMFSNGSSSLHKRLHESDDSESPTQVRTEKKNKVEVYRTCACGYAAPNRYSWSAHAKHCKLKGSGK